MEGYHVWVVNDSKKYVHLESKRSNGGHPGHPGHPGHRGYGTSKQCDKCPFTHNSVGCSTYRKYTVTEYTRDEFLALAKQREIDDAEKQALAVLNKSS